MLIFLSAEAGIKIMINSEQKLKKISHLLLSTALN
jgi:hypothetical protein